MRKVEQRHMNGDTYDGEHVNAYRNVEKRQQSLQQNTTFPHDRSQDDTSLKYKYFNVDSKSTSGFTKQFRLTSPNVAVPTMYPTANNGKQLSFKNNFEEEKDEKDEKCTIKKTSQIAIQRQTSNKQMTNKKKPQMRRCDEECDVSGYTTEPVNDMTIPIRINADDTNGAYNFNGNNALNLSDEGTCDIAYAVKLLCVVILKRHEQTADKTIGNYFILNVPEESLNLFDVTQKNGIVLGGIKNTNAFRRIINSMVETIDYYIVSSNFDTTYRCVVSAKAIRKTIRFVSNKKGVKITKQYVNRELHRLKINDRSSLTTIDLEDLPNDPIKWSINDIFLEILNEYPIKKSPKGKKKSAFEKYHKNMRENDDDDDDDDDDVIMDHKICKEEEEEEVDEGSDKYKVEWINYQQSRKNRISKVELSNHHMLLDILKQHFKDAYARSDSERTYMLVEAQYYALSPTKLRALLHDHNFSFNKQQLELFLKKACAEHTLFYDEFLKKNEKVYIVNYNCLS